MTHAKRSVAANSCAGAIVVGSCLGFCGFAPAPKCRRVAHRVASDEPRRVSTAGQLFDTLWGDRKRRQVSAVEVKELAFHSQCQVVGRARRHGVDRTFDLAGLQIEGMEVAVFHTKNEGIWNTAIG